MRETPTWTFLSNHAHVLRCVAADRDVRLRDVAAAVGLTERAAARLVGELEAYGYVTHERMGRRNRYEIDETRPLDHPLESHLVVRDLVELAATERRLVGG